MVCGWVAGGGSVTPWRKADGKPLEKGMIGGRDVNPRRDSMRRN
jgi:hypothetical protein